MPGAAFTSSAGYRANAERLRRRAQVRRKKLTPEDMDRMIAEVEVHRRTGISLGIACCHVGISEETYRKWVNNRAKRTCQTV